MIELTNDGKGLGFGIIGGRSTGVMVKTILPGGAAGQVNPLTSESEEPNKLFGNKKLIVMSLAYLHSSFLGLQLIKSE